MFIWFSVGFISVIFSLYQLSEWPSIFWLLAGLVLLGLAIYKAWLASAHFIAGVIIGGIGLLVFVFFAPQIPEEHTYETLWAEGRVTGLVEQRGGEPGSLSIQRFEFKLSSLQSVQSSTQNSPPQTYHQAWWWPQPIIRLSCYRCDWQPKTGEIWRLPIRIKPIHGSMNPGAFDYEAWAHQQGLSASGYVRLNDSDQVLLGSSWSYQVMRAQFAQRMQDFMQQSEFKGIYQALLYADRQALSPEDWEVMRATGTIHLMAISGLHMALVALMGFGLGALVWRLPIRQFDDYPVQWFGAAFAVVLVTLYGFLAGFTIPTQRAWIMVMVGVGFILLRRKFQPWPVLLVAAFLVVLWHPPSVLAQGFWLSFLAVALIFAWLQSSWSKGRAVWQQAIAIQLILSVGLAPALWWFYQQVPIYSLLANLVAVPFVSFIGLPLLFISALLSLLFPGLVSSLAWLNDQAWSGLWWFLQTLAAWPLSEWTLRPVSLWQVVVIYVGLFSAGLASARWVKGLALVAVLIALVWAKPSINPEPGEFWLTLLDVGQGQALVIETQHHRLVYDTGPSFGERFDGTQMAITPYLRSRRADKVDMLMISHADRDHAGGTARLIQDWPVIQKLSGEPARLQQVYGIAGFEACHHNQAWWWDEVKFEILAPGLFPVADHNDASCVLKVGRGEQSVMITGDLSARHERLLVEHYGPDDLRSSVLVAGHHGSQHSTHQAWLQALQPDLVLFSAGYRNRYGFPQPDTLARVAQQNADWLNTACSGAIQIRFTSQGWQLVETQRQSRQRWFHHFCAD